MSQKTKNSLSQFIDCYLSSMAFYDGFGVMRNSLKQLISCYRYLKLAANVEKPEFLPEQLKAEGYLSQLGQDKLVIEKFFPGKKDGVFVDIGANDGKTFSNTYLLEKMGWKGIAVEPLPLAYEKLAQNRHCITVHGCIAPESGVERFRVITGYSQMLSGLVEEYDSRHLRRIEKEIESHGGEYTDIEVKCYNFNELLESNGISQVDFLSIDVEGVEYKILSNIDFERVHISVIGVENNYIDYRIPQLLTKKGFEFHSILGDEFYRNKRVV